MVIAKHNFLKGEMKKINTSKLLQKENDKIKIYPVD